MAEETIRAIGYKVDEVGKYVKSSKKRFEWIIGLNDKVHNLILDFSFISGKVKAYVDGRLLLENEIPINTSFQYPFTLDGFALNLIQQGQNCELRINNKVFSHLYTQQKTIQEFKKDDGEFGIQMNSEFVRKLGSGPGDSKKITLEIGGANIKKNFKKNKDDDTWGAFTGIGFPPGLQPPPGNQASSGFGSEFSQTSQTTQTTKAPSSSGPVDFFDDSPSSPFGQTAPKVEQTIDIMGQDLLSTTPVAPPSPPKPQVNIASLYNTNSMMNTNQILFNTNVGNQVPAPVQTITPPVLPPNLGGPSMVSPQSPGLAGQYSTMAGLNLGSAPFMSQAGQVSFSTGMVGMQQNTFTQPTFQMPGSFAPTNSGLNLGTNPNTVNNNNFGLDILGGSSITVPTPVQTAPSANFQINSGFQTGMLNINQLYNTGMMMSAPEPAQQAATKTGFQPSASHDAMLDALIFQTGVPTAPTTITNTNSNMFNTMQVSKSTNDNMFDLI